jgi:FAD dependent oxidoreductase TIGR03364
MREIALRSRALWVEMLAATGLPHRPTGSLHLAYRDDELAVMREFVELGHDGTLLSPAETAKRTQAVEMRGLLGALWSETELTVDPRRIVGAMPDVLRALGVDVRFGCPVLGIDLPRIETPQGSIEVDAAIVCSGDDFETLYPEMFSASGLTRCKLQMMRTVPQPDGWELGPALAAGLTLRFYKAFRDCTTLGALRQRIANEQPEYDRWAIHTLVSQTADGAITLGDSHEYGPAPSIFDRPEIDRLILDDLRRYLRLPSWELAERWHGVYAWHPEKPFIDCEPAPGVRVITGVGGSGMTLSFGLAERTLA